MSENDVECTVCGKSDSWWKSANLIRIKGDPYCPEHAEEYKDKAIKGIYLTTTNSIEGRKVEDYIDIGSVEIVIGTGVFSEFSGNVSDFFGGRSTEFESKLKKAKRTALEKLKWDAHLAGANAVIGVDLDYTEFSSNRIGLIANGTFVKIS